MGDLKTEEAVAELESASKTIGSSIRSLFNAIGNSTVTAAVVIGLSLIICSGMFIASHTGVDQADERRLQAHARYVEIKNNASTGVVAAGIFGPIVKSIDADQITIKLKAVTNVTEYRVKWNIGTTEGLETFKDVVADVDGNVTLVLAKAVFGANWAADTRIGLQLYATDAIGNTISSKTLQVFIE